MFDQLIHAIQYFYDRPVEGLLVVLMLHYAFKKLHEKKQLKKHKHNSLFLRIGGDQTLLAAVDKFYSKVLQSEMVSHFFSNLDVNKQKKMMFNFLAYSFHSPYHAYDGRNMSDAHKNLVVNKGLNDNHFDEMVKLMKESLQEMNISEHLIDQAIEQVEGIRPQILCREGCYEPH